MTLINPLRIDVDRERDRRIAGPDDAHRTDRFSRRIGA
jgi:hypothetical protein